MVLYNNLDYADPKESKTYLETTVKVPKYEHQLPA